MIVSNEPGFYKTGSYGIRIENLVLVTPEQTPKNGDRPMMGFDTLTMVPLDFSLIDFDLLTKRRNKMAKNLSPEGAPPYFSPP